MAVAAVEGLAPTGPLRGVRVLDVSALGPGPFCSMLLADYGADVIAVERPPQPEPGPEHVSRFFDRGKRVITVDLRAAHGSELIARLADQVDVFLEGYRPGTMERRGLGPDVLMARNPRLVYTRLTGWGQSGPYALRAGHDINYIAVGGVLGIIGDKSPVPPLNVLGDFASGSVMAAMGTLLALFERERTGKGQVVDAAMADGAALLLSAQLAEHSRDIWAGRGRSLLSGGAPCSGVYRCADGAFVAVGAIEQKFYAALLATLQVEDDWLARQYDVETWPAGRARLERAFATRSRAEWIEAFAAFDACVFPVLEVDELEDDPHVRARGTVVRRHGLLQAAPAPRLSRTPARSGPPALEHDDTLGVLQELGVPAEDVDRYVASGTLVRERAAAVAT